MFSQSVCMFVTAIVLCVCNPSHAGNCDLNPCVFDGPCQDLGSSVSCSCPSDVSPCSSSVMNVFQEYDFDRHGSSEMLISILNPFTALAFRRIYDGTNEELERLGIPGRHNGEQDAIRHALVNYRWTKAKNAGLAKTFGDAHERSTPNPFNELAMDLHNNAMGRQLAEDPANNGLNDLEVILQAFVDGLLQRAPLSTHPTKIDAVESSYSRYYRGGYH